jgi:hypothetical protein
MDLHPSSTLVTLLLRNSRSKSSQEECPPILWSKTWTGCASAPLLLLLTQVCPVPLLRVVILLKNKVARLLLLELEPGPGLE